MQYKHVVICLSNEAPRGACETNDGAEDEICPIYPFKEMTISGFLPYVNGQYQGRSWGWGGGRTSPVAPPKNLNGVLNLYRLIF